MRSYDCLMGWQAHSGEVVSAEFSTDETTIYSMGTDGLVRINLHEIVKPKLGVTGKDFVNWPMFHISVLAVEHTQNGPEND